MSRAGHAVGSTAGLRHADVSFTDRGAAVVPVTAGVAVIGALSGRRAGVINAAEAITAIAVGLASCVCLPAAGFGHAEICLADI